MSRQRNWRLARQSHRVAVDNHVNARAPVPPDRLPIARCTGCGLAQETFGSWRAFRTHQEGCEAQTATPTDQ